MRLRDWFLSAALAALLAACGTSAVKTEDPGGSDGYLLTVQLQSSDTQEAVAQRYGGEVIVWLEGQRAVVKMSAEAKAALLSSGVSMQNTTLEANLSMNAPEFQASGWNAWSSGWNAWSSGWNAWSSGWNAWSSGSGTTPALPAANNVTWNNIRLRQAHAASRNIGAGVKVAVLDTGLDTAHPIFTGRLAPSAEWRDFVDNDANPQEVNNNTSPSAFGHGTAVAGIITQVAPRATILPVRVLAPNGSGTLSAVTQGIYWAADRGAQVINLSLGSTQSAQALTDAVNYAASRGAIVVASAGNSGPTSASTFPALLTSSFSNSRVMGIASADDTLWISNFSTKGWQNFAAAPGQNLVSAFPGNQTVSTTGTSFAAPLFAGAVALARSDTAPADWANLPEFVKAGLNTAYWDGAGTMANGVLDAESVLYNLPGFAPRTAASSTSFSDGFESGLTGWTVSGTATLVSANVRSGARAVQVSSSGAVRTFSGNSSIQRQITGLQPNTNYLITFWVRTLSTSVPFDVRNSMGSAWGEITRVNFTSSAASYRTITYPPSLTSGAYRRHAIAFTTGPTNTSVDFQVYVNGATFVMDDVQVQRMGY